MQVLKEMLRPLYRLLLDAEDWLQRWRQGKLMYPPRRLRDVGGDDLDDFEATGKEFLGYFIKFCSLRPSDQILEIGCGSGRIALALTDFLQPPGSYVGVDIVAPAIRWCSRTLTQEHGNFKFVHADLFNSRYNPQSSTLASEYVFPFENQAFDVIYLTSVFTHLLPEDLIQYLSEIKRVLRENGTVLATFFLLNADQQALQAEGKNTIAFKKLHADYAIRDEKIPASAVAYEERYLLDLLAQLGFRLSHPIQYGSWSGRKEYLSFQDILILRSPLAG